MQAMTLNVVLMFITSAALQTAGIALMPLSKGLTAPLPTAGVALCYLAGIGLMIKITSSGVSIGVLIPLLATVIPLLSILLSIVFFGDSASWLKIGLLVTACLLIGFASSL